MKKEGTKFAGTEDPAVRRYVANVSVVSKVDDLTNLRLFSGVTAIAMLVATEMVTEDASVP